MLRDGLPCVPWAIFRYVDISSQMLSYFDIWFTGLHVVIVSVNQGAPFPLSINVSLCL